MTKGPNRKILDDYLDTALGGHLQVVGDDWKRKAQDLQTLSNALKQAAGQAELRIGEQSLSGPALRAGMEKSATSMVEKADMLRAAGDALVVVGQQINDTKDARDTMADIGPRPAAYQAPANTTGVETTPEELNAQAQAAQARQAEINAWQTQYDRQEARSLTLTKQLDAAFIGAIPPMREIHGQTDPTEPTDNTPSGPDGPYLPGTTAPPPTGGGGGGGNKNQGFFIDRWIQTGTGTEVTTTVTNPTINPTNPTVSPTIPTQPPTHPISHPMVTETSTVAGSQQSGVTYQGPQVSTPTTSGGAGGAGGMNAAAFGAAGAAGGASGMMGGVRGGSAPAAPGSASTRPIGASGRSGSAGALSRATSPSSGSAAGRGATTGSPASRGAAGSAGARGAAGTAGSAGGRGGAGSAGGRGAASGSGAGSRSGRGASGARSAGAGAAAGRGGRKGDRDAAQQRDSLVYDQDWLGDDDVAPGVLD